jgi:hypothetical protein
MSKNEVTLRNSIIKTSDGQLLSREQRALMTKITPKGADLVLADVSYSMAGPAKDGRRCIDCLRDALAPLVGQIHVLAFDSNWEEVDADLIPEPRGGTRLDKALIRAKELEPIHVLVISDGESDGGFERILRPAKALAEDCVIDTMFIGDSNAVRAKDLMRELANIGGGRYVEYDIAQNNPLLLGGKINQLLSLPAPTKNVITLG